MPVESSIFHWILLVLRSPVSRSRSLHVAEEGRASVLLSCYGFQLLRWSSAWNLGQNYVPVAKSVCLPESNLLSLHRIYACWSACTSLVLHIFPHTIYCHKFCIVQDRLHSCSCSSLDGISYILYRQIYCWTLMSIYTLREETFANFANFDHFRES